MKTIKAKVLGLIVVCAVISTALCGWMSLSEATKISDSNADEIMAMQCSDSSQKIDTMLERVAQSVDTLAEIAVQSLTDFKQFQTSDAYVEEYTETMRPIALEFANNTQGALTYYIRFNPEFTSPTSGIFASRNSADEKFEQLTPTDFSIYDPSDLAHVGWYYIPVQNGKATWMDPYLNANINVYMISYVVPIYVDGVSVGIVGMDIDFGRIEEIAGVATIFETGTAGIVNSANQVMYHGNIAFGTALGEVNGGELTALDVALGDDSKVGTGISYRYEGQKKIAYYQKLVNGMKLVLTAPESEIKAKAGRMLRAILIAEGVAIIFAALVGFFLSNGITKPIRQVTEIVRRNAGLDLRKDEQIDKLAKAKDETGAMARAVMEMDEKLREMVAQLEKTGSTVQRNAEQLKDASNMVSEMCSDNSATTEELAAAMEEASATSEDINRNIGTVNENAKEIMTLSENGESDAGKILERAKNLSTTTQKAVERTRNMYEQVRKESETAIVKAKAVEKINELTQTILQISSQTNLLALNASIEAARAGEAGKGFAVVAEEIGHLASQTQETVKNIEDIISEVYAAVNGMKSCLNDSTEFLEKTVLTDYGEFDEVSVQYAADAQNFESSMKEITREVRSLGEAIGDIAEAIDGISKMTGESAQGISLIAEKTTEIVQKMSDETEMVEENRENAGKLAEIVGRFTIE